MIVLERTTPTAMAESFKNLINAQTMRQLGTHLRRVDRSFHRAGIERRAVVGLEALIDDPSPTLPLLRAR